MVAQSKYSIHVCCSIFIDLLWNVFTLVQVLLFLRGIGSYSAVYTTALGRVCLGLMCIEHFSEKLISCTLVARVLFVPLTWGLMSHSSSHLNLAGQCSTSTSSKCPRRLTYAVSYWPYMWPGEHITVVEAEMRSTKPPTEGSLGLGMPGVPEFLTFIAPSAKGF